MADASHAIGSEARRYAPTTDMLMVGSFLVIFLCGFALGRPWVYGQAMGEGVAHSKAVSVVMERGYASTFTEAGRLVATARKLAEGDRTECDPSMRLDRAAWEFSVSSAPGAAAAGRVVIDARRGVTVCERSPA